MTSIIRETLSSSMRAIWSPAIVLLLCAFASAATAAATADKPATAGDSALFERLDVNHNDTIAVDEVAPENRQLFERQLRRADTNQDQVLSRKEFESSLAPTRPAKPIEAKEPSTVPQANAVRYMLVTMDANRNARIEKGEVPQELKGAFEMMTERMDKNGNGGLERQELSRGGAAMSAVAGRYVDRLGIDVDSELAKLEKSQGEAFNRFEQQPMPVANIRDPKQARQLFAQIDEDADGKLDSKEVPDPLREPIERLVRIGDRDRDGKLTESEFVMATEQIAKFFKRREADEMPASKTKSKYDRKAKAADSTSDAKK